ncbi:MAG: hypothetical protein GY771_14325 [bacterium]|nr:hypothetical protein [bacterium]
MSKIIRIGTALLILSTFIYAEGFFDAIVEGIGEAVNWTVEFAVFLASHKEDMKRVYHGYYGNSAEIAGTMDIYMRIDGAGNIVETKAFDSTMGNGFTTLLEGEILTWTAPEKLYNNEITIGLQFDPAADIYGVDATYETE